MSILDQFYIKFFCSEIGVDAVGNRYFESKSSDYLGKKRRFVLYSGDEEPSRVPPLWHSWLHHLSNEVPKQGENGFFWQRSHVQNMTGTKAAYNPTEKQLKISAQYHNWQPK